LTYLRTAPGRAGCRSTCHGRLRSPTMLSARRRARQGRRDPTPGPQRGMAPQRELRASVACNRAVFHRIVVSLAKIPATRGALGVTGRCRNATPWARHLLRRLAAKEFSQASHRYHLSGRWSPAVGRR
jgi:hypothetical protein